MMTNRRAMGNNGQQGGDPRIPSRGLQKQRNDNDMVDNAGGGNEQHHRLKRADRFGHFVHDFAPPFTVLVFSKDGKSCAWWKMGRKPMPEDEYADRKRPTGDGRRTFLTMRL
jgi:hypothetical protein